MASMMLLGLCLMGRAYAQDAAVQCNSDAADQIMAGCTAVIQQGTETPQHLAMAYTNRSSVYAARGDYSSAIQDCSHAITLWPDDATAYYNRGISYASMNSPNLQQALADLSKAIQIRPGYAKAYKDRGYVEKALGQTAQAQADFDKAVQLGASPP